jgi:phenylacetate-CoA ligase
MTTSTTPSTAPSTVAGGRFDELAHRFRGRLLEQLVPMLERLRWDHASLHRHRAAALTDTLDFARARSRWHADRLADLDLGGITPDDLTMLPSMTKGDLMRDWDAIVTDERLDLASAQRHLEQIETSGPSFLHDEYVILTTGGSTGEPGVFPWSIDEISRWSASAVRWTADAGLPPPERQAHVAARSPRHMSSLAPLLLYGREIGRDLVVPVDQPLDAIVAALNRVQPSALWVVSSMVGALADSASSGALRIAVDRILVGGDLLEPAAADAAEAAFGVRPLEGYPTTDLGHLASQGRPTDPMTVNDDLFVVEPVDEHDRGVAPGDLAHHLLVTSLHQRTMPLIRYRVDDGVRVSPRPGPYPAFTCIEQIDGRADDRFTYATAVVHPHLFRSAISAFADVVDYEVRQTDRGADVFVVLRPGSSPDLAGLASDLRDRLGGAGVAEPEVAVTGVDELGRTAMGKRLHFVPRTAR